MKTILTTKTAKVIIWVGLMVGLIVVLSEAGWLIYHKPAFKGKVVAAETKQPIEGAVVVVVYEKKVFRFMPESGSQIIDVRETLTDNEGIFKIPSYTTIIDPLSWSIYSDFIIFKPGYGKYLPLNLKPAAEFSLGMQEEFFSEHFGKERELWLYPNVTDPMAQKQLFKLIFGVVELPQLRTREERRKASPSPVGEPRDWKKQKVLIKAIREEWKYLYNEDPKGLYGVEGE